MSDGVQFLSFISAVAFAIASPIIALEFASRLTIDGFVKSASIAFMLISPWFSPIVYVGMAKYLAWAVEAAS